MLPEIQHKRKKKKKRVLQKKTKQINGFLVNLDIFSISQLEAPLEFLIHWFQNSLTKRCCSGANWKVYEQCCMKQKCLIQMGIAQYKNAATPLRSRGINTTHQHFQMRYKTLIYLKGLKSYWSKQKCKVCFCTEITHLKFDKVLYLI